MSRRVVRCLPVLAIAATLALTGCGAGTKTAASQAQVAPCDFTKPPAATTVRVLAYNSSAIDPFTNTMVKNCTKDGVTVLHDPIDFAGQDAKTPVTLAGPTGTYDLLEVYGFEMANYAEQGKFQALDDLFAKYQDKYELTALDKNMVEALRYKGKLYGVPTSANVLTTVYRKDVFDKLGIPAPKTLADLQAAAAKIQQSGTMKYPVALPMSDPTTFWQAVMNAQGAPWRNTTTGQATWDGSESRRGWQAFADLRPLMDPQVTSFDQPKVQQQLYSGQAAIAMMYSGRMADLTKPSNSPHAQDFAFTTLTLDPGGKAVANLSVDGWAIPRNTKVDQDLVFQLIAASIAEEPSTQSLPAAFPARTSVIDDAKVPYAAAVKAALANGAESAPARPWVPPMATAVSPILISSIKGTLPVDQALKQCQSAAQKILTGIPANE